MKRVSSLFIGAKRGAAGRRLLRHLDPQRVEVALDRAKDDGLAINSVEVEKRVIAENFRRLRQP